jgi:dienelactone hydrolase
MSNPTRSSAPAASLPARPRRLRHWLLLGAVVLLAVVIRPAAAHVRAAALLLRFADERAQGGLSEMGRHDVDEEPATVDTARGPVRARVYTPRDVADAPGVVLVHGVHRLGIDEPRLTRFARAIAASGVVVLTPEVQEIADYTVDPVSVETIGAAARTLRARLGGGRAGVMGMSFAGGLSLLAAADPRFAGDIGFVVSVGGHHDLARVSRFFATSQVEQPDGSAVHLGAHGYGALVLLYANAPRFFPAEDVTAARDALRFWLWDDHDRARAAAEALTPASWAKVDALFDGRVDLVAPEILAELIENPEATAVVSPHGKLAQMEVPVFLLHGAGDTVIPAAETEWIAAEVPAHLLRQALVSPALVHVELGPDTPLSEKWALVHFMATVLEEAADVRG